MKRLEDAEQIAFIDWCDHQAGKWPELADRYSIGNGAFFGGTDGRVFAYVKKMKAMGQNPGVPDVCIPAPKGIYHSLYLEFKKPGVMGKRGKAIGMGKVSPEQQGFIDRLRARGFRCEVVYSSTQAIQITREYFTDFGTPK